MGASPWCWASAASTRSEFSCNAPGRHQCFTRGSELVQTAGAPVRARGGPCHLDVTRSRRGGDDLNLIPSERPSGALIWKRFGGNTCEELGGRGVGARPRAGCLPQGRQGQQGSGQEGPSHPCGAPLLPQRPAGALGVGEQWGCLSTSLEAGCPVVQSLSCV